MTTLAEYWTWVEGHYEAGTFRADSGGGMARIAFMQRWFGLPSASSAIPTSRSRWSDGWIRRPGGAAHPLSARARHPTVPSRLRTGIHRSQSAVDEALSRVLLDQTITLLRQIPPRQLDAVLLSAFGYRYREIGEQMGVSEGAVKQLIFRGRERLAA